MLTEINLTKWLCDWFLNNCNNDWEHNYGILIETLDNPGWSVIIDIENTGLVIENRKWERYENSSSDWYGYKIENGKFEASGDPSKLNQLIQIFKEIVEKENLRSL